MSKRCGKCAETKSLGEFHRRNRGDGYQAWCKGCRKTYDAAYSKRTLARRRERWAEKSWRFYEWYHALKDGKPCADCAQAFPAGAMQFDHRPGVEKLGNVGDLARRMNRRLVLAEIEKCDLVCATCHAIRTVSRRKRGVAQSGSAQRLGR